VRLLANNQKIAYVLISKDAAHSGVYKKILDQITFWRLSGYSVQLFVVTDFDSISYWQKIDEKAVILLDKSRIAKFLNRIRIFRLAIKSRPSLIYLRDSFPLRIHKCSIPIVIEVQSLVGEELKIRSRAKYLLFRYSKKYIYSRINAAVYVSRELLRLNEFQFKDTIPKITIGNGINLNRIEVLPQRIESKLGLFFVGNPNQLWHGVSELVEFARLNPDIDIHVVGNSNQTRLSNLFFYGRLTPDEYRDIASKCVAGIGSLNLIVIQQKESSSLKVREYLALGLPVILKHEDTDLSPDDSHVLQLPDTQLNLAAFAPEIRTFLLEWKNKRVPREEILSLDVQAKEAIRLEFFESILSKKFAHVE
jgi:hypothetical protein